MNRIYKRLRHFDWLIIYYKNCELIAMDNIFLNPECMAVDVLYTYILKANNIVMSCFMNFVLYSST